LKFAKILIVAVVAILSFWAGNSYSRYQQTAVDSEILRSNRLQAPELILRMADLVEKYGAQDAVRRMHQLARMLFESPEPNLDDGDLCCYLRPPSFGANSGLAVLRSSNDKRRDALRARIAELPSAVAK
jgi:hypothetical protein